MKRFIPLLALASVVVGTAQANPHDVFGTFLTHKKTAHVEIADCGDGSPCGTVVWIDPAAISNGATPEEAVDAKGQKILGLTMLEGFQKKKSNWASGKIYDPEDGKTYGSRLKRLDDGTLQVKGCIGPLCQTQIWELVTSETAN